MKNSFVKLQRLATEYGNKYDSIFYLEDEMLCLSLINVASFTHKIMGFYHDNVELLGDSENPKLWGSIDDITDLYVDFRQLLNIDNFTLVKIDDIEYYINMENLCGYCYVDNHGYELRFKDGKYYGIETKNRIKEVVLIASNFTK